MKIGLKLAFPDRVVGAAYAYEIFVDAVVVTPMVAKPI